MPDPGGARSLEEILASIRKSLADETVDGLVQLSAAAAAAAKAEAKPSPNIKSASQFPLGPAPDAPAHDDTGDPLSAKLAGALTDPPSPSDDLADLLAEPKLPSLSIPTESARTADTVGTTESKDSLWFLRPGAPEAPAAKETAAPVLKIDPFGRDGLSAPASDAVEEMTEQTEEKGEPLASLLGPGMSSPRDGQTVAGGGAAEPPVPLEVPEAELAPGPEFAAPSAGKPMDAAPDALLTRPESMRVPLFGGDTDQRKPIVSAPTLPGRLGAEPILPEPEPVFAAPAEPLGVAEEVQEPVVEAQGPVPEESGPEPALATEEPAAERPARSKAAIEPDVDLILADSAIAPSVEVTPAPTPVETPPPPAAAMPVNAPESGVAPNRPLEEMIAAVLEPVILRLLEKNLAPMLEATVRREVEKVLKEEGRR